MKAWIKTLIAWALKETAKKVEKKRDKKIARKP